MKRILIADASKASLVMTSEVFKDHFPGVQVVVARSSADAIELAKSAGELDAFIIDYDLPDRDGAYTAARLKKMFAQPILITAFDRPDVEESIARDLSAFDDCLSWLKKPVKPELVVSLAQRFIEGKHRCQRRLSCSIPAFLEVEFNPASISAAVAKDAAMRTMHVAKAKVVAKKKSKNEKKASTLAKKSGKHNASASAKTATPNKSTVATKSKTVTLAKPNSKAATPVKLTSKSVTSAKPNSKAATPVKPMVKAETLVPQMPVRKFIPVTIDDVSLGGAKIRIQNQELLFPVQGKSKNAVASLDFREGQILQVVVPPAYLVEAGVDALEQWQKTQAKELAATLVGKAKGEVTKPSKSTTLSPLNSRTQHALVRTDAAVATDEQHKQTTPVLKGVVRWVAASEMFTFCGLSSETVNVSKRLFESMIEIESRGRNHLSPIVSPSTPRGPKLNA